jgi:hypothetical protein
MSPVLAGGLVGSAYKLFTLGIWLNLSYMPINSIYLSFWFKKDQYDWRVWSKLLQTSAVLKIRHYNKNSEFTSAGLSTPFPLALERHLTKLRRSAGHKPPVLDDCNRLQVSEVVWSKLTASYRASWHTNPASSWIDPKSRNKNCKSQKNLQPDRLHTNQTQRSREWVVVEIRRQWDRELSRKCA